MITDNIFIGGIIMTMLIVVILYVVGISVLVMLHKVQVDLINKVIGMLEKYKVSDVSEKANEVTSSKARMLEPETMFEKREREELENLPDHLKVEVLD